MKLAWKKSDPKKLSCRVGPLAIVLEQKGDGRWAWHITKDDADSPMATGVAASLGAAKTVTEQFVMRSGFV